jgi:hypothetical protein
MLSRNGYGQFNQEIMRAKSIFNFPVTLSQANVKAVKDAANSCANIMHSLEALSVDVYRYDTQVKNDS